jgi:replicative DNA helicase
MTPLEMDFFTAMFLWPAEVYVAMSALAPEDFKSDDARKLYRGICDLAEQSITIDVLHVTEKLELTGMARSQARELIDAATDGAPVRCNIPRYCRKIKERAQLNQFAKSLELATQRTQSGSIDPVEVMEETIQEINEIRGARGKPESVAAKELCPAFLERAFVERSRPEQLAGLSTGIFGVDRATTGLRPAELWIVGALPGRGKTAFATQVLIANAGCGIPTLIFSLEMPALELMRRVAGIEMGSAAVRNMRALHDAQWDKMAEYVAEVSTWPLYVLDAGEMTPSRISAIAHMEVKRRGVRLVIVDYLQLIKAPGRDPRERVGMAANAMRLLAKDLNLPVVVLSQLRRPANLNDVPTMIDLRESGEIEAHANTVLLLYQPVNKSNQPTGEDEILIGKQRNGPLGSVPVLFDSRTLKFEERTLVHSQ